MYIIHEVSENILLVRLRIRPQPFMFKIPLFGNGHALWTSPNKGINPRHMSILGSELAPGSLFGFASFTFHLSIPHYICLLVHSNLHTTVDPQAPVCVHTSTVRS